MSANEIMSQISALPEREKAKLANLLVAETDWLEDVLDTAIAKARMDEPERPVEMLLREQRLLE
ncbi:MAG: hypothetical protein HY043_18415 [Verrucomicrobia bacterium]|nr:hypothetical protein [Verrucomicrobiota bacterium]